MVRCPLLRMVLLECDEGFESFRTSFIASEAVVYEAESGSQERDGEGGRENEIFRGSCRLLEAVGLARV